MSISARAVPPVLLAGLLAGCLRLGFPAPESDPRRPAPETEGTDADARPLRLSAYRGKVVLLDFWRQS
jgi:hypothetical protein